MSLDRRTFLRQSVLAGSLAFARPLEAFWARLDAGDRGVWHGLDYGPLVPTKDENTGLPLLELPEGFRYLSFGWTGDPLEGGRPTPGAHDGMAAFPGPDGRVLLIRNHEEATGPAFDPDLAYDEQAPGGTTTLEFDPERGIWIRAWASMAGTVRNCAGGPTPWGSWLTCEETLAEPGPRVAYTRKHGYIFEVPVAGTPTREPLVEMGRFVHEAVAVDPATGIVYETEDAGNAGLYRFIPRERGNLAKGGRLEMLAIQGEPKYDTRPGQPPGTEFPIIWVPIDEPDRAHDKPGDNRGVYSQGLARGAATFARLEGAWHGSGKIFVTATSGGAAKMGQVWEVDLRRSALRLVFESPGAPILAMPDNLCVSPRGALVVCEDGPGTSRLHGLSLKGELFPLVRSNLVIEPGQKARAGDFRESEFAGVTFSPDGRWMFFNVQSPGVTFAVTGPWERGSI
jgi:secreted PhoX family phosphatase